jgi:hypothetical protein
MTAQVNVDLVTGVLTEAGYKTLEQPIIVGGIPFEATAVLAKDTWLELIAIIDTVLESDTVALRAKIEGLGRALDLVGSRRALTVILVGPRGSQTLDGELKNVARVLSVTAGRGDEDELRDALAVLLPLDLASASDAPITSWSIVRETLREKYAHKDVDAVFRAVPHGRQRVRTALRDTLTKPFNEK